MTIATATITGSFVGPDLTGDKVMSATYEAYADGTAVTYTGLGVIGGRRRIDIQDDGTATVTIPKIPQAGLLPAVGVFWLVRIHLRGRTLQYFFTLTADTTWDAVLTPANAATVPTLLGDVITARDAALAAVAAVKIGTWQPTTAYVAGQTVQAPDGSLIKSNSARTSRASFDATEQTFWTPVATSAGTLEQLAQQTANDARFVNLNAAPLEVNATKYGITTANSAATNSTNIAALFAAITSDVVIHFPQIGTYNFSSPLPNRNNVGLRGAGLGTVLTWTAGSMLTPTSTVVSGWHFSDLSLTTSGATAALIDLGTSQQGMTYSTFERCYLLAQANGASIIKGTTVVNFFGIRFRDCQLWRSPTSTVSGITITSNTSGLNSVTWDNCLIHSQAATTAPFIRLESTAAASYVTGIRLSNIVGEQNAGGIFHGFGINSCVVDNVIDYDQSTYSNSLFKLDTGSGGVQSYGGHFDVVGTSGPATFSTGGHVTIVSGDSHYLGRVLNGPTAAPVITGAAQLTAVRQNVAGLIQGLQTLTTTQTLNSTHRCVLANGSSITITLPSAVTSAFGREYVIKNLNATSCTVASAGGTIDGSATKSLAQFATLTAISDGTNWNLI